MKVLLTSDTHYGLNGKTHSKHSKFWKKIQKEIETQDIKVLIWAGDVAVNKQRQFKRSIEQAREHVDIPILLVRGNHDFWDVLDRKDEQAGHRGFHRLEYLHQHLFKKYDIHHLERGPKVIDNVLFCGWDGWYGDADPPTNDAYNMFQDVQGCPMHVFMSNRAWQQFDEILAIDLTPYRASVAVTHHNPYVNDKKWEKCCANPKFYDIVKERFDYFCCGHNHQRKDNVEDSCRVLNSGSDYNDPKYLIFEV